MALWLRTRGCSLVCRLYAGLHPEGKECAQDSTQSGRSAPRSYQRAGTWALHRNLNRVHSRDGQLALGVHCVAHSAAGWRQTLQDLQPRGGTQTHHQLLTITLLLKVEYEGWLLNRLAGRALLLSSVKRHPPPNALLTNEPLHCGMWYTYRYGKKNHRCLWGLTDPEQPGEETFTQHKKIPGKQWLGSHPI